jgi:hypothetical protein
MFHYVHIPSFFSFFIPAYSTQLLDSGYTNYCTYSYMVLVGYLPNKQTSGERPEPVFVNV